MKKLKEKEGITLVALVVTIVILLILAGVSISLVLGQNGLITKTQLAKQISKAADEQEAIKLDITLANMEKILNADNKYYIGEPLFDRTLENGDKWNIVIENETLKQYGTGYNYISKGTEISNYGKTQYDWLINYRSGEIIQLDSKYTTLSYKSSLAVTDSLALNIDATNLNDDNWGDVVKHGDVKYMSENKSLYFDGDGDYLELTRDADFSNGFTFEIYANLEQLKYNNGSGYSGLGLFCKIPSLQSKPELAMRFGDTEYHTICKFYNTSSWQGNGSVLYTTKGGEISSRECGYNANEDFYLTFIYKKYNESNPEWDEKADKIEYYINGDLYGYTYHGIDSYNNGCDIWNNEQAHFYLGVSPWYRNGNLYYLKGNVYCTRLYERALSSDEVKENVTKTQMYRQMK